jgi:hypothetical protein
MVKFFKPKKNWSRGSLRRAGERTRQMLWVLSCFAPGALAAVDLTISTTPGMSWNYNMTQELGEGVSFSDLTPAADGKFHAAVMYRLDGTETLDGKELLKFEMHRAGVVTNTDLITVDQRGVVCLARIGLDEEITKLATPQILVATPLQTGTAWDFDDEISHSKVHQHYRIIGEENVEVPAGKFRAFHIRGDQTSPTAMTIDRWFVNGTGIVKDVTETRTDAGALVRRISLELSMPPRITARPEVKPVQGAQSLRATLGTEPIGKSVAKFTSTTPKVYARWQGHGLRGHARIRAVWIAENIGEDAPRGYTADQASATATAPECHGIFTLSRPDNGWTPGDYRMEFYVDDALADTVKVKVTK